MATDARAVLNAAVSEEDYQAQILALARGLGWRCYHTRGSRGSDKGWPDLAMVRGATALFLEVKVQSLKKGVVTPEQQGWIAALNQVRYVHAAVARPSNWPEIEDALRRTLR